MNVKTYKEVTNGGKIACKWKEIKAIIRQIFSKEIEYTETDCNEKVWRDNTKDADILEVSKLKEIEEYTELMKARLISEMARRDAENTDYTDISKKTNHIIEEDILEAKVISESIEYIDEQYGTL